MVLMMKPRVGETALTSSCMMDLTMVVFPALSRPSIRMRISLSFRRDLRRIESMAVGRISGGGAKIGDARLDEVKLEVAVGGCRYSR
jgi:hypothetical protein